MTKRILSLLLCMAMVFSSLPLQAFADEETTATTEAVTEPVEETTVPTEPVMAIAEETTASTEAVTEPQEETTAPTEAVTEPVEETTAPTEAVTEPEEETTAPTKAVQESVNDTISYSSEARAASTPVTLISGVFDNGMHWRLSDDGELKFWTDPSEVDYSAPISIPDFASPEERPWHDYRDQVESISSYCTLQDVGDYAFYECINLWDASMFQEMARVGKYAFYNCKALLTICGCEVIEEFAFAGCTLLDHAAAATAHYIGNDAFAGCTALNIRTIELSDELTHIGDRAFSKCTGLEGLYIPKSVGHIGEGVFEGCTSLLYIAVKSGNTTFSGSESFGTYGLHNKRTNTLLAFPVKAGVAPELPTSTKKIGGSAFRYFDTLTSITIPWGAEEIGNFAFAQCLNLKEISFTGGAPAFAENCFADVIARAYYPDDDPTWTEEVRQHYGGNITWIPHEVESVLYSGTCGDEATWELDVHGALTISGTGKMYDYTAGQMPWYSYRQQITKVVIKSGITNVGAHAFSFEFTKLKEVYISSSVTEIGEDAFGSCSALTQVVIPQSVLQIGEAAFTNCSKLATVSLPDKLSELGGSAFFNCNDLTEITIPASVKTIGEGAFYGCDTLASVTIKGACELGEAVFAECYELKTIYFAGNPPVMASNLFAGVTATAYYPEGNDSWTSDVMQNYGGTITWEYYQPSFVATGNCGTNLTWTLNDSGVLTISGTGDMYDYSGTDSNPPWYNDQDQFTKVVLEQGVTGIGAEAFAQCTGLTSVSIAKSVRRIGDRAFADCSGLLDVIIPDGVTAIGDQAFTGCASLSAITVPDTVIAIGTGAFSHCTGLIEALLSNAATSIGDQIFEGCFFLSDVYYDSLEADWNSIWRSDSTDQSSWIDDVTLHWPHLAIYSSNVNLFTFLGETISLTAAMIIHGKQDEDTSGITFQVSDDSVLKLVRTGTTDRGFVAQLRGLKLGTTTVVFSDSNSGCMAIVPITINERNFNDYTIYNVPKITNGVSTNNFRFNGLYVDDFTYSLDDSTGTADVTFEVYNGNYVNAIAEVYDSDGELYGFALIEKAQASPGSLKDVLLNGALLVEDALEGDIFSYRMEAGYHKHTSVSLKVPLDGYISITTDPVHSPLVQIINEVDVMFSAVETSGKFIGYADDAAEFLEVFAQNMVEKGALNTVKHNLQETIYTEESMLAYVTSICDSLTATEIETIAMQTALDFNFTVGEKFLDFVPFLGTAFRIIFGVGKASNLLHQTKGLHDSYYSGKLEIQNPSDEYRKSGSVVLESELAFHKEVSVSVFEVTLDDGFLGQLKDTSPAVYEALTNGTSITYNISLLHNKEEIQHNAPVTVYIPIPLELKALAYLGQTNVYRVEEDGTVTNMQAMIQDGCFVFTTDHFSLYVLSGYDAEEDTPETIVASGTCGENLTWTLDENGLLTISGSGEMTDYNSLDCGPWQEYAENILKIVVEPGVTRIGDYAFKLCYNAQEVSLPDSLTGIGQSAFMNCAALQSVTVPAAVTEIGEWAFGHCGALTDVQLSAAITEIPHHAFYNCDSLQNISIPGSVTAIGDNAFEGCNSLETISLPSGLETIGKSAFFNCVGLGEIVLPDSVTTLGQDAFCYCESLTRVVIGSGLTTIAGRPFGGCSNLTVLTVAPENSAFVSVDNVLFNRDQTTLICCAGGKTGSYTIPGTVTAIADDAFEGCCISGIVIPDTVTQIGSGAFCRCRNLTEVVLPGSITSIESETFSVCESLTRVVIPASVTSIGYSPFWICENLREIRFLGSAPTFLYNNAFEYVTATAYYPAGDESWTFDVRQNYGGTINWVSYETETPDLVASGTCGDNLTWTLDENGLLTISGTGSMTDFLYDFASAVHASWYIHRDAITQVVIDNGVTTIGNYAFYQCRNLTGVTIPESVISIGNNAFSSCWSLSSIAIPDGVTSIGECAFSGCSGLTSITLPEGLTEIADQTFNNCISLSSITIPESVTSIGWSAFGDCDGLTSITIPENVTSIGDSAFDQCSYLNSITLPDSLLEIGGNAFYACQSLTQVTIPASVTSIGDTPFYGCMELTEIQVDAGNTAYCSVDGVLFDKDVRTLLQYPGGREGAYTIPDTVTDIGGGISYAVDLTELTVPESVTSIPGYAFYYCMSLNRVTFQGEISSIGMLTFGSCSSIRDIYFTGDAPVFEDDWIFDDGAEVNMHYPMGNATWTDDVMQDYGGTLTWIPYGGVENRITVPAADLAGHSSVWIDGVEYAVQRDGDNCYVDLPVGSARTMVTHSYNIAGTVSSQTRYPVGMKVWMLENRDGVYTAVRQEVFDDILQYSGMSIRVTGKKGIRMITSIQQSKKNALVAGGLEGLTLKEYGTVVAWASNLTEGNPLVLGQSYAISNYAYRKGVADPVFAYSGSLMQYTNVLVNFSDEQCKHDIALRPYMILEDASGETVTIYGGIVYRSIGYIAYQNRNVFEPQTEEYNYIWDIIHYVYGDVYDDEFAHAWTPPSM